MGSVDGLVEIHPRELQFVFEVKKQSSCSVHLVNKTDEYVAFKVKTTSPKRYCVRPNIGVILPRATCVFTVTMQAQKTAPPDLQIKDKFLVQTTVVPSGITDEGVIPAFFSKETRKYIEENKLRVVLVSATQPEAEQPIHVSANKPEAEQPTSGVPNAKTASEVPVAKETSNIVNELPNVVNEVPHPLTATFPAILSEIPFPVKETPTVLRDIPVPLKEAPATSTESAIHLKETPAVSVESHSSSTEMSMALKESPPSLKDTYAPKEVAILSDVRVNAENLHLSHVEDAQNLKSELTNLEVKLKEAEILIRKLREEARSSIRERDKLQHEIVIVPNPQGEKDCKWPSNSPNSPPTTACAPPAHSHPEEGPSYINFLTINRTGRSVADIQ